jgi:hypothetical protein
LECSASSYYFASGLHLTFKSVSGHQGHENSSHFYFETQFNQTQESVQIWSGGSIQIQKLQLPLRQTVLAENVLLPPGDYELSCYAPVWNSTQWISKSVLVSVSSMNI